MSGTIRYVRRIVLALVFGMSAEVGLAQNPVQWSGNTKQAVARAAEQTLPLLFWVTGGNDLGDDDLSDAQSECFRDPAVVNLIHKRFVPVRVSRNTNVIQESQRLGLPTTHGLFCAVVTHDGRLLDQMGPVEVADPRAFVSHLNKAFATFCDDLYNKELRPIFDDPAATKAKVRLAAQTVWRLGIRRADKDIINLLSRKDLQPTEVSRLYELLASLGTEASVVALLDRASDRAAVAALARVDPSAIEWLLAALPGAEGEVTPRQLAAYQGAVQACRALSAKPKEWWEKAKPEDRRKELDRVRSKAEAVLDYVRQAEGSGP
jgi:hypothetical protein